MTPRWVTERKYINKDNEILQVIEVYAEKENKEQVKRENRKHKYKRELILVGSETE